MPKEKDELTVLILSVLTKEPQSSREIGEKIGMDANAVRSRMHTNSVKHLVKFYYGQTTMFSLRDDPDDFPQDMVQYKPWTTRLDPRSQRAAA